MFLVLVEDYPTNENKYPMAFVHTRMLYYKRNNINSVVLNFRAENSYFYEGIKVICLKEFKSKYKNKKIETLISHAPNVKNHLFFIKKYNKRINHVFMFFHGHEALKMNNYYPKPYNYVKNSVIKKSLRNVYDKMKLSLLKKAIQTNINKNKINLVFVSVWMYENFLLNTGLKEKDINNISSIIPNSISEIFIKESYKLESKKIADFVTIRPLDNSKYGIDIVSEFALRNPDYTFHIYGKGKYFEYNSLPENITLHQNFISQNKIPEILNKYKVALMPTRLDAQGVMACEIATFQIPMITSDIPICKEVLSSFDNVFYMNNETFDVDLEKVLNYKSRNFKKTEVYFEENTIQKEIDLISKQNIK